MLFSQRKQLKPIKEKIQIDSIDNETRNRIWSAMCIIYWENVATGRGQMFGGPTFLATSYPKQTNYFRLLWFHYFKEPIDTLENDWNKVYSVIRDYCLKCHWNELFDFIEFLMNNFDDDDKRNSFRKLCNVIFEQEFVGYRIIENRITEITSETEIVEIDEAINQKLKPVSIHLSRALELLSDRKNPDYRNSIKESISAVESYCKIATKKESATLGEAIKLLEKSSDLHPAFKDSILKLYGYTNDAKGIRHALMDIDEIEFSDAKFMLVSCSAFINYFILKETKN